MLCVAEHDGIEFNYWQEFNKEVIIKTDVGFCHRKTTLANKGRRRSAF